MKQIAAFLAFVLCNAFVADAQVYRNKNYWYVRHMDAAAQDPYIPVGNLIYVWDETASYISPGDNYNDIHGDPTYIYSEFRPEWLAWAWETCEIDSAQTDSLAAHRISIASKLSSEVDGSVTNEIELPSQTGNNGKFLSTNGTSPSWVDASGPTWSFNNSPGRTIQTVAAAGNGWQVSSTRPADVSYSVTIGTTVSLSGNSTGYVVLEIASTNSSTAGNWTEIARVASGQSGTLVIGLVLNQTGGGCLSGSVPAGYYVRVRSVNTAGTPSYTMNSGQEVTK